MHNLERSGTIIAGCPRSGREGGWVKRAGVRQRTLALIA